MEYLHASRSPPKLTKSQFRRDVHEISARQVDGIADSVTDAMDSGVDQVTDLADTIMPVCTLAPLSPAMI